jgi:hypothetical protein
VVIDRLEIEVVPRPRQRPRLSENLIAERSGTAAAANFTNWTADSQYGVETLSRVALSLIFLIMALTNLSAVTSTLVSCGAEY